jgi:hypothetical protein
MPSHVNVRVRLDRKAINHELRGRTGAVGRTMAAFAGVASREIKDVFIQRAGGPWWPVSSSLAEAGARGVSLRVDVRRSQPHQIVAVSAPLLIFNLSDGTPFRGTEVSHPGSTPPVALVLTGIERAGRRLTFTPAQPTVTLSQ